jgi:N-acetyl-gamma-glutamyl-phosphate reductase
VTRASEARVAVVGATGYAGAELVRLLSVHPGVEITIATSERDAGRPLGAVHRSLAFTGLELSAVDVDEIAARADFAFIALPHGASTAVVAGLLERGLRVIDLGADFRLSDRAVYEQWYGEHGAPHLLSEAVYGLTEFTRQPLRGARLVANPGCYPTGMLLATLPLADAITGPVIVDSKSGTSGAGRAAKTEHLFAEVTENVRPYGVARHRHQPEMQSRLSVAAGREQCVLFVPHLLPVARGLLSTCYVELGGAASEAGERLRSAYEGEGFVRVLGEGQWPEPRNVRGTNLAEIGWVGDPASGRVVVISAIDNLGKGAAGQAVHNMNVMLGLEEGTGLTLHPALP